MEYRLICLIVLHHTSWSCGSKTHKQNDKVSQQSYNKSNRGGNEHLGSSSAHYERWISLKDESKNNYKKSNYNQRWNGDFDHIIEKEKKIDRTLGGVKELENSEENDFDDLYNDLWGSNEYRDTQPDSQFQNQHWRSIGQGKTLWTKVKSPSMILKSNSSSSKAAKKLDPWEGLWPDLAWGRKEKLAPEDHSNESKMQKSNRITNNVFKKVGEQSKLTNDIKELLKKDNIDKKDNNIIFLKEKEFLWGDKKYRNPKIDPDIIKDKYHKVNKKNRPNIILIVADDLGYNDVPWHNPDVKAPHLNKLARRGIILENHYVLPVCTPSRAALLTGMHPFRYGRQIGATRPLSPIGLNTSLTLLPQRLQRLGYKTHMVGKWHLGYCSKAYTPTQRGFDSFYGFYLGSQTYFTHFRDLKLHKDKDKRRINFGGEHHKSRRVKDLEWREEQSNNFMMNEDEDDDGDNEEWSEDEDEQDPVQFMNKLDSKTGGYDFRFNDEPLINVTGLYSNDLFATRAEDIFRGHWRALRRGEEKGGDADPFFMMLSLQAVHGPLQVPLEYRRKYKHIPNIARRTFLAMVSALDDTVGRVVEALKAYGLYNNTIIAFTSDNGGNIRSGGNNFPLRGSKGGLYEGGTKGVAFLHSPLLPETGFKYTGLMHIVDWHNTLLDVAGGGLASWGSHEGGGHYNGDGYNLWPYIVTNTPSPRTSFVYNVRKGPLRGAIRHKNWKLIVGNAGRFDGWIPPDDVTAGALLGEEKKKCCSSWQSKNGQNHFLLFNLKDDPLETTDVSDHYPQVVSTLKSRLRTYALQSVNPQLPRDDPQGHPALHGGFYSSGWCNPVV